jgi:lupus La protein
MKIKEKGIDTKAWRNMDNRSKSRQDQQADSKRGPSATARGWNAFTEMERVASGKLPNLAAIPEGVAVVGKALPSSQGSHDRSDKNKGDKKRPREDDENGDGKPAKQAKVVSAECPDKSPIDR